MTTHAVPHGAPNPSRLQRFGAAAGRASHAHAPWLVGTRCKLSLPFAILPRGVVRIVPA